MFIEIEELNTVIDEYKLNEITDNNTKITQQCLIAAESRTAGYLRKRYDVKKLFSAKGEDRDPSLMETVKNIALYLLVRRHNIDMLYGSIKEGYDVEIDYLKAISEGKIDPGYPLAPEASGGKRPTGMRSGSRKKFNHEF